MQKLYYSISEVSRTVDEEQHILRYWEKEFEQLQPKKNRGGNRVYSERDIILIKLIKKLLRNDKLSLKGAKEQLQKYYQSIPDSEADEDPGLFKPGKQPMALNRGVVIEGNRKGSVLIPKAELAGLSEALKEVLDFLKQMN